MNGPIVAIAINGHQFGTIPLALLEVTSTRVPELVYNGTIDLSSDTDPSGVMVLVNHLINICRSKVVEHARLCKDMSVFQSLAVCQAAFRLGMTKYTNHLFRKTEAYISNTLLPYDEIDAVVHFGASHPRLYRRMVNRLAVMAREEAIPDPEAFAQFCYARPALNTSIVVAMGRQAEKQERAQRKRKVAAHCKQRDEGLEQ